MEKHSAFISVQGLLEENIATGAALPGVAFWFLFSPSSWGDLCGSGEKNPILGSLEMLWLPVTQRWAAAPGMYLGSIPKGGDFGKSRAGVYGNKPCLPALFPNPGDQNPLIVIPASRDSAEGC